MKKAKIPIIVIISFVVFSLLIATFLSSNPRFDPTYFTAVFQEKFASPEAVFERLWKSHISGDKDLYAEVFGRRLKGSEREMGASSERAVPKIEKVSRHKNSAYIQTTDWGGSFEKIGGRWVFQNEEVGFYCRQFFRVFGIETAKFLREG